MGAIIKREVSAYFTSAIAYVVMAVFFLFSGMFFWNMLYYDSSNLIIVFSSMFMVTLCVLPMLTMKLLSDEKRQKTDQALLTAPISVWQIVLGKFISAEIIYLCCMAIYIPMTLVVACFTAPQWGIILCNLIGMFLLGSSIIAIGVFISSLTESQVIAAVAGIATGFFISMLDNISAAIGVDFVTAIISWISFMTRYQNFYSGIFNIADAIYFLSVIGLFLFLTTRVIDRKRWS
ncbi:MULTISPECIES: ABC transporter permease [unclassified Ruminococcus]|uniref:ABC transporter permease n=1 Tax=unclassified Ruminococcus TaxID=2608920 RepID=UPI00210BF4D5|nr:MULTISPECIES: ABC transporter permease subunit [unclassified Ruminococcus]MCQ4021444.1 ABC transporter permease subunit [Ruminococcus sp. zg-924]MCQ4113889.1 ABC transporter permease subunit [Ruminococcus sp. zg-921]